MRSVITAMLGIVLAIGAAAQPWSLYAVPWNQNTPATGQAVLAFAGGSVWTSDTTGTCIWFFPVLGNLDQKSLFAPEKGKPVVDKEHAYLIWISDWSIETMFTAGPLSLAVLPAGDATVYYTPDPTTRDFSNLSNRSTWGIPIAKFARGGGLFQSPDEWKTDRFFFSARLQASTTVTLKYTTAFNFSDLIPNGMTCFEFGANGSTAEAGTCVAMAPGL